MPLNQRERFLAISLGSVLGLLALAYLLVIPFFERGAAISRDLDKAKQKKEDADNLVDKRFQVMRNWNKMKNTGVLRTDPAEAGQQVASVLQSWAGPSGVNITSSVPDSPTNVSGETRADKPEAKFKRVNINVTATGTMRGLSDFLWRVESSPMIVRVTEINITSRQPATDNLQMVLKLATVSPLPDADKGSKPASGQAGRNGPVAAAQ